MKRNSIHAGSSLDAAKRCGWLCIAVLCAAACGASGGPGGSDAAGAGAAGSDDDVDFGSGGGSGDPIIDESSACATSVTEGVHIPVTMYIMFDKSGSMLEDQKWAGSKAALIAFFQDEDSAGLRIALRFFPDDDPVAGCNEAACSVEACSQPLVEAGELNPYPAVDDPHQKALVEAVESRQPNGQTPMYAALAGAETWARAHAAPSEGTEKTVVVLVTDGEPNGCNEDIGAIAALAGEAAAEGVLTYAIGMAGSNEGQLDQVAAAGNTDSAFFIGQGSVHTELVAALKKIKKSQLACTFALPEAAEAGEQVDPHEVNVNYTDGSGKKSTLGQVSSASGCGTAGGWYYDDPEDPAIVALCPGTCDAVQADADASIQIVLGCATQVN
jgi:hypothetical protein